MRRVLIVSLVLLASSSIANALTVNKKVYVVTGASGYLGSAIATQLCNNGNHIIITGRIK